MCLLSHIPKASRAACGSTLTQILQDITHDWQSLEKWDQLFLFGRQILAKPSRGGRKVNITKIIKSRLSKVDVPVPPQPSRPISKKPRDANQIMAAAVTAKIEEGNLKAAVRILCSDEQPAEPTLETLEKLQRKHPVRSTDRRDAPPLEQLSLSVDKSLVLKAIRSFPNGSSGGSDGFRPGHLKDLISCQEISDRAA